METCWFARGLNYYFLEMLFEDNKSINEPLLLTTVVQKLNRSYSPENGLSSFSGRLFWYFFGEAKKYKEYLDEIYINTGLFNSVILFK